MKKIAILLLLLASIMLIISCKQPVYDNEQVIETDEPKTENGGNIDMENRREYDFDLEKTIEVLQQALPDEEVTEEDSIIIDIMRLVGIRGATQARLIGEPGRERILEVVCEDNRTYEIKVVRRVYSDEIYYSVDAVKDMQTGEYIYAKIQ